MPDIVTPLPSTSAPTVVATIGAISDQSTLAAVNLSVSVTSDGNPVVPTAYAWRVNAATTGISDATAAAPTFTPTAAGTYAVSVSVTVDGIVYYAETVEFAVGSPQRFHRLLTADFREAHTISGDGPVTIGGVSVAFANTASASITVDATNGIDITRTGGSSPTATVDLDATLTALSHTINPSVAGREYLFVVWGTATAGGSIAAWNLQDASDQAPQFRFGDGVASDLYMQTATGVSGAFTEAAIGNVWVLRLKDTVAELYVGTATQGSWDYDLSDLTRTQSRVWGNSHAANVSAPAWGAGNFEILSGHSAINDRTQWRGLDVLVRNL